jgi:ABC-2 type transport system permease protein
VSARRLRAIVTRVVLEVRRDRPSLALLFIAPLVVTGLLTFILRDSSGPAVRVALANEASGSAALVGGRIAAVLEAADMTVTEVPTPEAARAAVRDGTATIAILLPANLGASPDAQITLVTKGLDPAADASQVQAVSSALIGGLASALGAVLPMITRETVYGTPSGDPMAPFAPAIVAFFLYFFVYLLTGVSFLRERTGGTLERLMATPVTRGEVVVGYTLGFGLFAMIQVTVLLCWALGSVAVPAIGPLPAFSVGLGIAVAGSPLLAFLVVLLLALGAVSLGIFLSTFARTELQVIQFIPVVLVPQFLLSGVLFPVDSLPSVLQPLVSVMPLSYAVDALREVFIRGADLSVTGVQVDVLVLAAVAVLFAAIASRTIRRDVV